MFGRTDIKRQGEGDPLLRSHEWYEKRSPRQICRSLKMSVLSSSTRERSSSSTRTPISSKKMNRIITAEDNCKTADEGAEILARVADKAMDYLEDAERISCLDLPTPVSPPLQNACMLGRDTIAKVVKSMMQ